MNIPKLVLLLILLVPANALLGVMVMIEVDPPSPSGTITQVTVSAKASGPAEETITSLNFPFDLGGDGFGLPTDFSFSLPALTNSPFTIDGNSFNTATAAGLVSPNFDVIVNLNTGSATLPASQASVVLFDLNIEIAPGATPGPAVPVILRSPSTPVNFFKLEGTNLTTTTLANAGAGSVILVPEPSSFWFVGLVAAAGLTLRKLRAWKSDSRSLVR